MSDTSPQQPPRYVPPPVPPPQVYPDLMGDLEGRPWERDPSPWRRFRRVLRVMWGKDI